MGRWRCGRFHTLMSVATFVFLAGDMRGQGGRAAPTADAAAVTGLVIDGLTNAPVPDAIVSLTVDGRGTVGGQDRQITDAKGRFAFLSLPANDRVTISATKFGYLAGGFNLDNRPGTSGGRLRLREGEWIREVRVTLWRPGVIAGTVTDERGEPVAGVYVRVMSVLSIAGRQRPVAGPLVRTDDRGAYRVADLGPGRYVVEVPSTQSSLPASWTPPANARVSVQPDAALQSDEARLVLRNFPTPPPPSQERVFGYPAMFSPGTASVASAGRIDLRFGEERTGVDIALRPVAVWRVSGNVDGPAEARIGLMLRLVPEELDGLGYGSEAATVLVGADGRFTFANVPPGAYVLDAPRAMSEIKLAPTPVLPWQPRLPALPGGGGGGMTSWLDAAPPGVAFETITTGTTRNYVGRATVTVGDHDETGVVLSMHGVGMMTGTITVEPRADLQTSPIPPSAVIQLDPVGGEASLGLLRIGGAGASPTEFMIPGLLAGQYWLRTSAFWVIKSIRWQGRDYTDVPFDATTAQDFSGVEVTVTKSEAPVLKGVAQDDHGAPAGGARIVAFPTDRARWTNYDLFPSRVRSTHAAQDGSYRFADLPAGDYYVAAFDAAQSEAWFETAFLEKAATLAKQVVLQWRETTDMNLVTRVPR
jgi:Carboxypeptidase regulatory-like domain